MALPQKFYLTQIFKNTKYRANWLPDKPLRIGDVGRIQDGVFTLYTTLEQQQIPFRIRVNKTDLKFDFLSNDSVKIEGGATRAGLVRRLTEAEVCVVGHIGLTPQSVHSMGGYRVQGKTAEAQAKKMEQDSLKFFDPWMAGAARGMVLFHGQMLNDFKTIEVIGAKLLAELT